jgi:hypothetical protein
LGIGYWAFSGFKEIKFRNAGSLRLNCDACIHSVSQWPVCLACPMCTYLGNREHSTAHFYFDPADVFSIALAVAHRIPEKCYYIGGAGSREGSKVSQFIHFGTSASNFSFLWPSLQFSSNTLMPNQIHCAQALSQLPTGDQVHLQLFQV